MNFEELIGNKTMYIRPTNEKEISEILENLNKHSAPGQDNITIKEIHIIKKLIVPYLVVLINNIFLTGIFPDILKTGKITPIYKSGDKSDIQNYRPITITDSLSKLIETLMAVRISGFLSENIGFDVYQYGFLKNSSTLSAATDFINFINTKLDDREYVLVVYIDLKKAFDVVDHELLLNKLNLMGIRGVAHTLIQTYLQNRNNFVYLRQTKSQIITNHAGVPQGSVLGPLLFAIYILSLRIAKLSGKYFIYADDAALVY